MRVGRAQAARLKPDSTTRPSSPRRISDAATRHSAFTESHGERHASAQQKYGRVCARDDRARVGARRGARTCCGCFVVLGWSFLRASVCCTFQIGHKFHAPGLWVHDACATVGADTWLTSAVTRLVPLAPNATPPKPLGWKGPAMLAPGWHACVRWDISTSARAVTQHDATYTYYLR